MPIHIQNTADIITAGVKILVYGHAGAGKTRLNATLPSPIILSAESGLLSLRKYGLPYIAIESVNDLHDAHEWLLGSKEAEQYQSVSLDSISEIAEVILNSEKKIAKDPRQAYGAMQEQIADLIRAFRDIPNKHVYFSAKAEKQQNEMGKILYSASLPGNKAPQGLPYFFDEVLALRVEKNPEGELIRSLQTGPDGTWDAKDRSDALDMWEAPDLGAIIEKIGASMEPVTRADEGQSRKRKPAKKSAAPVKRISENADENRGADEDEEDNDD